MRLPPLDFLGKDNICFTCGWKTLPSGCTPGRCVLPQHNIFICESCKDSCIAENLRVKSIDSAKFTQDEVNFIRPGGNKVAAHKYFAKWEKKRYNVPRFPPIGDTDKLREWIRIVLIERRYCKPETAPPSQARVVALAENTVQAAPAPNSPAPFPRPNPPSHPASFAPSSDVSSPPSTASPAAPKDAQPRARAEAQTVQARAQAQAARLQQEAQARARAEAQAVQARAQAQAARLQQEAQARARAEAQAAQARAQAQARKAAQKQAKARAGAEARAARARAAAQSQEEAQARAQAEAQPGSPEGVAAVSQEGSARLDAGAQALPGESDAQFAARLAAAFSSPLSSSSPVPSTSQAVATGPPLPDSKPPSFPSLPERKESQLEENDAAQCIICLSAPRTCGLVHAGSIHICVCRECKLRVPLGSPCPLCRQTVECILDAYL